MKSHTVSYEHSGLQMFIQLCSLGTEVFMLRNY